MASRGVNKVILVGNLGQDPEVRYMPSGGAVANFTLATSESWRDKQTGEMKEQTEWHRVVLFGKLAEVAGEYLRKGSQVYIEGQLRTRKWTDQSGQDKYTTEVVVNVGGTMQMLGGRQGGGAPAGGGQQQGGWGDRMEHQHAAHRARPVPDGAHGTPEDVDESRGYKVDWRVTQRLYKTSILKQAFAAMILALWNRVLRPLPESAKYKCHEYPEIYENGQYCWPLWLAWPLLWLGCALSP